METEHRPFPYLQLFGIVCASAVVMVILFWVWHMVEMRSLQNEHQKQNATVRAEIVMLEAYVSTLGSSTVKKVR